MNAAQHVIWATEDMYAQNRQTWTIQDLLRLASKAAEIAQARTKKIKAIGSFSTIADRREYDFPPNILQVERIIFDEGDEHLPVEFRPFKEFIDLIPQPASSVSDYTTIEEQRRLMLGATPDTAAATTTLGANVLVTDLSITGADFSAFPARNGRLIINDEVMEYDIKSADDTQCTGLQRGLEGTQITAHTSGDTVTHRNITVYGAKFIGDFSMGRYYTVGTASVSVNSTALVGVGTTWTGRNVLKGNEFGVTDDPTSTDPQTWYVVRHVVTGASITFETKYLEATETRRKYIIASANPMGSLFDGAIHQYILAHAAAKDGDSKSSTAAMRSFADELGVDEQEIWRIDRPLTVDEGAGMDFMDGRSNVSRGMRVDWTGPPRRRRW